MTEFEKAVEAYREPSTRAVSLSPHPADHSVDNGLLFSARYLLWKKLRGELLTQDDYDWFLDLVSKYSIEPGLLSRYPGSKDFESHDDLSGVAMAGFFLSLKVIPLAILNYGESHDWSWNSADPGVFSFRGYLARIVAFVPHLRVCAGQALTISDQLEMAFAILSTIWSDSGDTSGRLLMVDKVETLRGRYPLIAFATTCFDRHIKNKYGGLKGLATIYYGKDHPFTVYCPELPNDL